jgi:outer membrane protein assembly factor BamB
MKEYEPPSKSPLALPFKNKWEYLTDELIIASPVMDDSNIYLPLADGRIQCLGRNTGSLIWTSDTGAVISSQPLLVNNSLLVSLARKDEKQTPSGIIKALDKSTGLTLWVHEYSKPFTSTLVFHGDNIYGGNLDGFLYSLSSINGDVIWRYQTGGAIKSTVQIAGEQAFLGGDDGVLRGVELSSGREIFRYTSSDHIRTRPLLVGGNIYFGTSDGYVNCLTLATGKLKWRSLTGGAVEANPVLFNNLIIFTSFDNYIYGFDLRNGNRVWKRRFDGRLSWNFQLDDDCLLMASEAGSKLIVILAKDGSRINMFQLKEELYFYAAPVFSRSLILVSTERGLMALEPRKPTKSAKKTKTATK